MLWVWGKNILLSVNLDAITSMYALHKDWKKGKLLAGYSDLIEPPRLSDATGAGQEILEHLTKFKALEIKLNIIFNCSVSAQPPLLGDVNTLCSAACLGDSHQRALHIEIIFRHLKIRLNIFKWYLHPNESPLRQLKLFALINPVASPDIITLT